jgi:hypothetical protein
VVDVSTLFSVASDALSMYRVTFTVCRLEASLFACRTDATFHFVLRCEAVRASDLYVYVIMPRDTGEESMTTQAVSGHFILLLDCSEFPYGSILRGRGNLPPSFVASSDLVGENNACERPKIVSLHTY